MQLVIFDVDGTLVDSQHNIVEAQARAFAVLVGPDGPLPSLSQAYKDAWTAMRGETGFVEPLYPGARDIIADLRRRPDVQLGLATGKSRKGVERVLAEQGWSGAFATIQTADDHPSKPHPSMILTALDETGIAAGDAFMVGDTTFDMVMAAVAGVRPLGVGWGYHDRSALLASGAEAVADDFTDLRARLELRTT